MIQKVTSRIGGVVCAASIRVGIVLQALALLNDPFVVHQATRFAGRLRREAGEDLQAAVQKAFEHALGRPPTDAKARRTLEYARAHGLENLCRVVFNLNEFYLVD